MPNYIIKRNGTPESWDPTKIQSAVHKAMRSIGNPNAFENSKLVTNKVLFNLNGADSIQQEEIQNLVEKCMMESGFYDEAKSFILYREKRRETRDYKQLHLDINNAIDSYLEKSDWRVNENANMDYCYQGLVLNVNAEVESKYCLNKYPEHIRESHLQGYFHIHDLAQGLVGYCAGWSLYDLLLEGFNLEGCCSSAPGKHFDSVLSQMINFIGTLQNEWAGAQAFSSLDTLLAPFVWYDGLTYKQVKQAMQRFVYNMNTTSRWGGQCPFSNITFDLNVPKDYKNSPVVLDGKLQDYTYDQFEKEMEMINKAFLEVMLEGDYHNRIFSFPIPTYNITKDFDWDSEVGQLILQMTAKYGAPYFQNFINSDMEVSDVRSFCCRLQLDKRQINDQLKNKTNGLFGSGELTGSVGVVTINLPRLAYLSNSEEEFFSELKKYTNYAKESLEFKRKLVDSNFKNGLLPWTKRYLKNGFDTFFSTIGIIGGHEACLNLLGKGLESEEGVQFMEETLEFLRDLLLQFQRETGNMYNLEATPAEGCIAGDTVIHTIDGEFKVEDLVGKEVGVYSFDVEKKKFCVNKAYDIRKTRSNVDVLRVTFDNDTYIDLTPDHPVAVNRPNRWGYPTVLWVEARDLEEGHSIKSLYFHTEEDGRVNINTVVNRANVHYEYYFNDIIYDGELIHHKDLNPENDSQENLEKMSFSEHKALHAKIQLPKPGTGEKNPFYGKSHSEETKNIISENRKGKTAGDNNPCKRDDVRRKLSVTAKNKPREKHSKFRKDINEEKIIELYKDGYIVPQIARELGYEQHICRGRLKANDLNHKVKKVEYLEKKIDVYNMEVENTDCYFAGDGVLIHNCSYKLARLDKRDFPYIITSGEEEPYYTNSTQLHVNSTDDVFFALRHQDRLQPLYTGGTVFHTFIGESVADPNSVKNFINKAFSMTKIPYLSITPTFSICKNHGYFSGQVWDCPKCGEPTEVYSRVVGYFRPINRFNKGKKEEYKERKTFDIGG